MIESTFEDFPSTDKKEIAAENSGKQEMSPDDSLVSALPVVQKIVRRKIIARFWTSDGIDLVQGIVLRLVKWRHKYQKKSSEMSEAEWQSFAARTAYNEINRHFSKKQILTNVPHEPSAEFIARELVKGNSEAEVCSLVRRVWQEICLMTLRQRQALLLSNPELIFYLLQCGITDENLAEILNLNVAEWVELKEKLPLSEMQIANLMMEGKKEAESGNRKSIEGNARSVKKARYEARAKLRRLKSDEQN